MSENVPPLSWFGLFDVWQLSWRIKRLAKQIFVDAPWQHLQIESKSLLTNFSSPIHIAGTKTATVWQSYIEGALQSAENASAEAIEAMRK